MKKAKKEEADKDKAATKMQAKVRAKAAKEEADALAKEKAEEKAAIAAAEAAVKEEEAAIKVQALARTKKAKEEKKELAQAKVDLEEASAAVVVQKKTRAANAKKEKNKKVKEKKENVAATAVQSKIRGQQAKKEVEMMKLQKEKEEQEKAEADAATAIQAQIRVQKAQAEAKMLVAMRTSMRAATIMQKNARVAKAKAQLAQLAAEKVAREEGKAASAMQAVFRGIKTRMRVQALVAAREAARLAATHAAATKIQAQFRVMQAKKEAQMRRIERDAAQQEKETQAAIVVQSHQRAQAAKAQRKMLAAEAALPPETREKRSLAATMIVAARRAQQANSIMNLLRWERKRQQEEEFQAARAMQSLMRVRQARAQRKLLAEATDLAAALGVSKWSALWMLKQQDELSKPVKEEEKVQKDLWSGANWKKPGSKLPPVNTAPEKKPEAAAETKPSAAVETKPSVAAEKESEAPAAEMKPEAPATEMKPEAPAAETKSEAPTEEMKPVVRRPPESVAPRTPDSVASTVEKLPEAPTAAKSVVLMAPVAPVVPTAPLAPAAPAASTVGPPGPPEPLLPSVLLPDVPLAPDRAQIAAPPAAAANEAAKAAKKEAKAKAEAAAAAEAEVKKLRKLRARRLWGLLRQNLPRAVDTHMRQLGIEHPAKDPIARMAQIVAAKQAQINQFKNSYPHYPLGPLPMVRPVMAPATTVQAPVRPEPVARPEGLVRPSAPARPMAPTRMAPSRSNGAIGAAERVREKEKPGAGPVPLPAMAPSKSSGRLGLGGKKGSSLTALNPFLRLSQSTSHLPTADPDEPEYGSTMRPASNRPRPAPVKGWAEEFSDTASEHTATSDGLSRPTSATLAVQAARADTRAPNNRAAPRLTQNSVRMVQQFQSCAPSYPAGMGPGMTRSGSLPGIQRLLQDRTRSSRLFQQPRQARQDTVTPRLGSAASSAGGHGAEALPKSPSSPHISRPMSRGDGPPRTFTILNPEDDDTAPLGATMQPSAQIRASASLQDLRSTAPAAIIQQEVRLQQVRQSASMSLHDVEADDEVEDLSDCGGYGMPIPTQQTMRPSGGYGEAPAAAAPRRLIKARSAAKLAKGGAKKTTSYSVCGQIL